MTCPAPLIWQRVVYGHHWYVDPPNRLTVIALTNTAIEGMMRGFVRELMETVYGPPSR